MFTSATCWSCSPARGRGGPSRTPWSSSWWANFTGTNHTRGHFQELSAELSLAERHLMRPRLLVVSREDFCEKLFFFFYKLDVQSDVSLGWGLFLSPYEFDKPSMWRCHNSCACHFLHGVFRFKDEDLISRNCVLFHVGGKSKILSSFSKCFCIISLCVMLGLLE